MWYIYQQNNQWLNSQTEPSGQYITIKRMPPKPVKSGYTTTLMADFVTEKVWYEQTITEDGMAIQVRTERNALLAATDYTQVMDARLSADCIAAFKVYRQALADIPEQSGFPFDVVWPDVPETVKAVPDPVDVAVNDMATAIEEGVNAV